MKVTLITDAAEVEKRVGGRAQGLRRAQPRAWRSMTDESVDTFYSCLLCQSFAPNHVCVITPSALGLCGAYNWLDGKAAYEIDETGPNQPVQKGDMPRPGARAFGRASTTTSTEQPQDHRVRSRAYSHHGPAHDELRLLRGHLRATCPSATASWSSTASSRATPRSA